MRGMVMMENRVVMNVASVMSEGFLPYFIQNIVPKDATGMAITTVLMLLMSVLTRIDGTENTRTEALSPVGGRRWHKPCRNL